MICVYFVYGLVIYLVVKVCLRWIVIVGVSFWLFLLVFECVSFCMARSVDLLGLVNGVGFTVTCHGFSSLDAFCYGFMLVCFACGDFWLSFC